MFSARQLEFRSPLDSAPLCGYYCSMRYLLSLLILCSCKKLVEEGKKEVYDDVVKDTAAQLYITIDQGGSKPEICMHAQILSAACLQAKDSAGYRKAKGLENLVCAAAGMSQSAMVVDGVGNSCNKGKGVCMLESECFAPYVMYPGLCPGVSKCCVP